MTAASDAYRLTVVPRIAVRLPAEIPPPEGFDPAHPASWPDLAGRLEYVEGRLLFMPPCGDLQQQSAADVVTVLNLWRRQHPEFIVGGNEAGMLLAGEVRAADAAVWRRADLGANTGGFPRVPPLLAVEVAGADDDLDKLQVKARWYLDRGTAVVWLLDPSLRIARVVSGSGILELRAGQSTPPHPDLPGLSPSVDDFFSQVAGQ